MPDLTPALPHIIGMSALAFILSIVIVLLTAKAPKCMVYTMAIIVFILMITLTILLISMGQIGGAIIILITLAILGCFIYCSRDQIDVGITLLKVSG